MYTWDKVIAITNRHLCKRPFLEQIEIVCQKHPHAIILREKDLSEQDYLALLLQVKEICTRYDVCLIAHYYPEAARKAGINRIHLPLWKLKQEDVSDFALVGCSIHAADEAVLAVSHGAGYLTAGHIFATDCKKGVPPRGLPFLRSVLDAVDVPVYGIGGIDADNAQSVLSAGASGICIMSSAMTTPA